MGAFYGTHFLFGTLYGGRVERIVEFSHGSFNQHSEFDIGNGDVLGHQHLRSGFQSLLQLLFAVQVLVNLLNSLYTGLGDILFGLIIDVLLVEILNYDAEITGNSSQNGIENRCAVSGDEYSYTLSSSIVICEPANSNRLGLTPLH